MNQVTVKRLGYVVSIFCLLLSFSFPVITKAQDTRFRIDDEVTITIERDRVVVHRGRNSTHYITEHQCHGDGGPIRSVCYVHRNSKGLNVTYDGRTEEKITYQRFIEILSSAECVMPSNSVCKVKREFVKAQYTGCEDHYSYSLSVGVSLISYSSFYTCHWSHTSIPFGRKNARDLVYGAARQLHNSGNCHSIEEDNMGR